MFYRCGAVKILSMCPGTSIHRIPDQVAMFVSRTWASVIRHIATGLAAEQARWEDEHLALLEARVRVACRFSKETGAVGTAHSTGCRLPDVRRPFHASFEETRDRKKRRVR